ncbi:MAG: HEPN domain-containing protein [Bacillota bacterium]|nr:HEPN domain-containing protein [Bacillota bacterium]
MDDARRWLAQARADLGAAEANAAAYPYVACLLAQQAAEKALKAAQMATSGTVARTHSLSRLYESLDRLNVRLSDVPWKSLRSLERKYAETRYPDALPDDIPARYFVEEDAREAIETAASIVTAVEKLF